MPLKLLDDKRTYAEINSDKPEVCFLHGWGRSSNDFNLISKDFAHISFDLPGFGKSLEPLNSYTPKEYAYYINDFIPDSVNTLVGHSFGGRVAVYLSEIRNFDKLILISTPLISKHKFFKQSKIFQIYKKFNKIGLISENFLEEQRDKHGSVDYRNAKGIMRQVLVKAVNDDLSSYLKNITTKVHLVWGELDSEVPLEIARESNSLIQNSELHILEGESHNPLLSSYNKIIDILKI